jgi:hypothetical protein
LLGDVDLLDHRLHVVPVWITDERRVGAVLRPVTWLVPRRSTGRDGRSMERVNGIAICGLKGKV